MRVGLDLHTLSGLRQGSRTYMANLAARLPFAAPDMDFVFYATDPDAPAIRSLAPDAPNVAFRPIPHGRLARLGSSLRVDSAREAPKPPMPRPQAAISAPPAIITSASP